MAILNRKTIYSSATKAEPVAKPPIDRATALELFFKAAHATLMPESFNVLCARAGIDAYKDAPKASKHGPCWECRFFQDGNHCGRWGSDVPMPFQIDGCGEHKAVVYTGLQTILKDVDQICPF